MFTDIVGYTTMMSQDEQATLAILRTNRETHKKLILEFGGHLLKEMGDGILASFDNSTNAVICAAAIQKASIENQIELRIGIHMGEVTFENNDVFGDGVNIASRIQPLAEPSQILISETVHHNVQNKPGITTQLLGERELKNVLKTVAIYIVEVEDDFLTPGVRSEKKKSVIPLIISIAAVATVLFTAAGYWFGSRSLELPGSNPAIRYEINMEGRLTRPGISPIAFSNDGKFLCYTSARSIFVKSLAETGNGFEIEGPWDPRQPSFSADGNWIIFEDVATSSLVKIPVTGGDSQEIYAIESNLWGFHCTENEIIFCDNNAFYIMDLNGGSRKKIYPLDTAAFDTGVFLTQLLPDNKTLLYHQWVNDSSMVKALRLDKNEGPKDLIEQATYARYLKNGQLVFLKEGSLQLVEFDLSSNSVVGPPRIIASGIRNFAINDQGTLVYQSGRNAENNKTQLVWIDPEGRIDMISKEPALLQSPRVSRDGQQIAVDIMDGGSYDIVIYNPELGTATNFITQGSTISPIWAPDNNTIAYFKFGNPQGVFIKPLDNSYSPKLLFETAATAFLGNWSNDGRYMVFSTAGDIGYFDFADSTVTFLDYINAEEEFFPMLSPDGNWLAYTSDDDANNDHVYVVPFPGPGRAHRVSVDEGFASVWAPDMSAIYLVGLDKKDINLSQVDIISTSPQFSTSLPRVLFYGDYTTLYTFTGRGRFQFGNSGVFDIHPDGNRFLMEQATSDEQPEDLELPRKLQVVVNWQGLLEGDN
jgi:Tol biopolymer transport system component